MDRSIDPASIEHAACDWSLHWGQTCALSMRSCASSKPRQHASAWRQITHKTYMQTPHFIMMHTYTRLVGSKDHDLTIAPLLNLKASIFPNIVASDSVDYHNHNHSYIQLRVPHPASHSDRQMMILSLLPICAKPLAYIHLHAQTALSTCSGLRFAPSKSTTGPSHPLPTSPA